MSAGGACAGGARGGAAGVEGLAAIPPKSEAAICCFFRSVADVCSAAVPGTKCVCVCVRVYELVCLCACMDACVCVFMDAWVHICVYLQVICRVQGPDGERRRFHVGGGEYRGLHGIPPPG